MLVLDLQVYYWVISSNLILRCTWTYKLSAHLRHNYLTLFTITALEIFRRFQWIFFRVENEWNKMTTLRPSLELATNENPREDERLLGPSNHNVWTKLYLFLVIGSSWFSNFLFNLIICCYNNQILISYWRTCRFHRQRLNAHQHLLYCYINHILHLLMIKFSILNSQEIVYGFVWS